ncbi:OmpA family protein [Melioribacter sp. OK-6-Me]|uniref:OmpA family protein n=1 Tax=unclassified Melioribacter TaxID=2627329 RepID=UPI003EDA5402
MKKIITILFLLVLFVVQSVNAQLSKNSWAVGVGFDYPRYVNSNITATNANYGAYLSIQRNFSEHVGLRLSGEYLHLEGEWGTPVTTTLNNTITGDLNLLYYLAPCEPVSPYLSVGGGVAYRMLTDQATPGVEDNAASGLFNAGLGVEWCLSADFKLVTEGNYNLVANSEFDGALGVGEINGKDSYLTAKIGVLYYFKKGEPSKLCNLYSGLSVEEKALPIDYARIEEIVQRYIPKEVVKEVVVEKPTKEEKRWILVGVNFEFNSAELTAESYPILYDAVKTLLANPDMKVEIQGYTDNIGSEEYNKKLSQKRADAVKNYLIAKGVNGDRLTSVGYGESNPIADNKTAEGRAANRRIEFVIR